MKGIVAIYEKGNSLVVNCTEGEYVRTQQNLTLLNVWIEKFDLKAGDKVEYGGRIYEAIKIIRKLTN